MANWLSNFWASIRGNKSRVDQFDSAWRMLQAKYDAAQNGPDVRHWNNADSCSADAANSKSVRRTLVDRSRYEVANNSFLEGMIQTKIDIQGGVGPRLQYKSLDPNVNKFIENDFNDLYRTAISLTDRYRTMKFAKCQDGEGFGVLRYNPRNDHPIKTCLDDQECDRFTELLPTIDPWNVDGIQFDRWGNPVTYEFLSWHPGDRGRMSQPLTSSLIPAKFVIHLFRRRRPGQHRGIPEIMSALPISAMLRRLNLAALNAYETAALFSVIMETQMPAGVSPPGAEGQSFATFDIERNTSMFSPPGWKATQLNAAHPNAQHDRTVKCYQRDAGRSLTMPFGLAAGDHSSYNYSSSKADGGPFDRATEIERDSDERLLFTPLFEAYLREGRLVAENGKPHFPGAAKDLLNADYEWLWPDLPDIDEEKEAAGQTAALKACTTTYARIYGKRGLDWDKELRQFAREQTLIAELNIPDRLSTTPARALDPNGDPIPQGAAAKKKAAAERAAAATGGDDGE